MHIFGITISDKIYIPVIVIVVAVILDCVCQLIMKKSHVKKHKYTKLTDKKIATLKSVTANVVRYLIYIVAVLIILNTLGINTTALITGVGVASLVLGLAFQDILKDILAGFSIIFDNMFNIGDFVKIGDFKGTVISLGLKTTRIKAYTGEIKIISNRNITDIVNYSLDNTLAVVDIAVSYESNLDKVEKILNVTAATIKEDIPELTNDIKILGVEKLEDSSVVFRIVGKCKPAQHFDAERKMKKEFKNALDKNGIKIPYPQVEVHNEK